MTRICRPVKPLAGASDSRGGACCGASSLSIAAIITAGSASLPVPISPQAVSPSSGAISATPLCFKVARLACVAGCAHIFGFIAGAIITGQSVARQIVLAKSSARPCAILARKLAVAGATSTMSASRASLICPISASSVSENSSVKTFSPVRADRLSGVINSIADLVITPRI